MLQHLFDEHYEDYPVVLIDGYHYCYGLHIASGTYAVENVECAEDCIEFATREEMMAYLEAVDAVPEDQHAEATSYPLA